ncbi:TPA: hypothetical protein MDW91_005785 [Klebsiella pneumoniae]|nr:hypothetical protein [Klebsiella pneumoniae]HBV4306181.1 hypothetical protein [Klebsiella pneumoniae]
MFAGKKSAQIREILISESAWEEMTCLFAPSLGDVEKVAKVFVRNELSPLQDRFREVNDWLGMEVIRFKEYTLDNPDADTKPQTSRVNDVKC